MPSDEVIKLEKCVEDLESKVVDLQNENRDLELEVGRLTEENTDLDATNQELDEDSDRLQEALDEAESEGDVGSVECQYREAVAELIGFVDYHKTELPAVLRPKFDKIILLRSMIRE